MGYTPNVVGARGIACALLQATGTPPSTMQFGGVSSTGPSGNSAEGKGAGGDWAHGLDSGLISSHGGRTLGAAPGSGCAREKQLCCPRWWMARLHGRPQLIHGSGLQSPYEHQ